MVGACGIWRKRQCQVGTREWLKARVEVTHDVNAAIEGLRRVGYQDIRIKDLHGRGMNLCKRMLNPAGHYESGISLQPIPILGKIEGAHQAVLIGFHARAGTEEAFYPHTFRQDVEDVKINGQSVGEVHLIAAVLGTWGIEVPFVSGDDATVKQAKEFMPWLETLAVPKDRQSCSAAQNSGGTGLIRKRNEMRSLVERSCNRPKSKDRVFHFEEPLNFEIRFQTTQSASFYNSWGLHQTGNLITWQSQNFLSGYQRLIYLLYVPRSLVGVAPYWYRVVNTFRKAMGGRL
jgi:D-amino peptidase